MKVEELEKRLRRQLALIFIGKCEGKPTRAFRVWDSEQLPNGIDDPIRIEKNGFVDIFPMIPTWRATLFTSPAPQSAKTKTVTKCMLPSTVPFLRIGIETKTVTILLRQHSLWNHASPLKPPGSQAGLERSE